MQSNSKVSRKESFRFLNGYLKIGVSSTYIPEFDGADQGDQTEAKWKESHVEGE